MARAATSPELTLFRTPGKWSRLRCAIIKPPIVYRARINQTFTTYDQVLSIVFDGGSGTLASVLPDMEVWIGSSLDAHDKGICRLRDKDATHFYLSETSEITFANDDYVTILAGFGVWARPVRIATDGTIYMDETTYTDQHTNWDPQVNMGSHQIVELTGASVNTGWTASTSFCPGSSISTWAWSCATAAASAGTTTDTCTLQFNTAGLHIVYLTATAANGKSFFGIRYCYIWDTDSPPPLAEITNPGHCDVDSGGWEIELRLYDADIADIYDRAMVILFSEDHYGDTVQAIGPVVSSENVRFVGWISGEAHHIESEQSSVTFEAKGAAWWMTRIPSWPDGVEITSGAASWTRVPSLTVDLGAYHWLRWRTTITRIMDVTLSGDTRYSPEVASSAQNLWAQLQDMTWAQIYARPGVNAQGQFSLQIHPSLIPTASRTAPTVMAITTADYTDGLDFERSVIDDVSIVDMSGIQVTSAGAGTAYFALAPGHSLPHYGDWDIQPNLLLESQAQVITQAGLFRSWRNNPYKDIPIIFDAPIGLIDCFPNQKCTIDIQAADNARGISYAGGLFPLSVDLVHDPDTGYLHTEVTFEAETAESQARVGDTPGSGTNTGPVSPSFPPLPPLPPLNPGIPLPSTTGPTKVLFNLSGIGLVYTENFNEAQPDYYTVNAGSLGVAVAAWENIVPAQVIDRFFVTPSGAVYAYRYRGWGPPTEGEAAHYGFVARAPSIGAAFVTILDPDIIGMPPGYFDVCGISVGGYNPLVPDTALWLVEDLESTSRLQAVYIGSGGSLAVGYRGLPGTGGGDNLGGGISYGLSQWLYTQGTGKYLLSQNGSSLVSSGAYAAELPAAYQEMTVRASTTGITYGDGAGLDKLIVGQNNLATVNTLTLASSLSFDGFATDPTGVMSMGRYGAGLRGKSSDYGATWATLGSLPVGSWVWKWAGGAGVAGSRWVAGGATIQYTDDFGTTWHDKTSASLLAIDPTPSVIGIQVIEY